MRGSTVFTLIASAHVTRGLRLRRLVGSSLVPKKMTTQKVQNDAAAFPPKMTETTMYASSMCLIVCVNEGSSFIYCIDPCT
ncbi:hypothetical protein EDB89DRAFT_520822 [Lactarius sanguifluus]|nr:hypothetical protein EDB89DRAFT_520822 [Lactarius sanguifluus]